MNTTGTLIVVGAVGVAVVLYMRSQQQQAAAVGIATQQQQQAAAAAGGGGGGGVTGFAQGLWTQWKGDPLGIKNTKAALSTAGSVVKEGAKRIISLPSDIIGGIRGLF